MPVAYICDTYRAFFTMLQWWFSFRSRFSIFLLSSCYSCEWLETCINDFCSVYMRSTSAFFRSFGAVALARANLRTSKPSCVIYFFRVMESDWNLKRETVCVSVCGCCVYSTVCVCVSSTTRVLCACVCFVWHRFNQFQYRSTTYNTHNFSRFFCFSTLLYFTQYSEMT